MLLAEQGDAEGARAAFELTIKCYWRRDVDVAPDVARWAARLYRRRWPRLLLRRLEHVHRRRAAFTRRLAAPTRRHTPQVLKRSRRQESARSVAEMALGATHASRLYPGEIAPPRTLSHTTPPPLSADLQLATALGRGCCTKPSRESWSALPERGARTTWPSDIATNSSGAADRSRNFVPHPYKGSQGLAGGLCNDHDAKR